MVNKNFQHACILENQAFSLCINIILGEGGLRYVFIVNKLRAHRSHTFDSRLAENTERGVI